MTRSTNQSSFSVGDIVSFARIDYQSDNEPKGYRVIKASPEWVMLEDKSDSFRITDLISHHKAVEEYHRYWDQRDAEANEKRAQREREYQEYRTDLERDCKFKIGDKVAFKHTNLNSEIEPRAYEVHNFREKDGVLWYLIGEDWSRGWYQENDLTTHAEAVDAYHKYWENRTSELQKRRGLE